MFYVKYYLITLKWYPNKYMPIDSDLMLLKQNFNTFRKDMKRYETSYL